MMREVKDPAVRKIEIMDCAMKLFAVKGYENTTMTDIAKELKVAVGLCYHYFKSKQCLYDEALAAYVDLCSEDIIRVFDSKPEIEECMKTLTEVAGIVKAKSKYSDFFDKNKQFHMQLEYEMAEKIAPHLAEYLKTLKEEEQIGIDDPLITAKFILHGEMALYNDDEKIAERLPLIRKMVMKVLAK